MFYKDADALDRVRFTGLTPDYTDFEMLRLEHSKHLLAAADAIAKMKGDI